MNWLRQWLLEIVKQAIREERVALIQTHHHNTQITSFPAPPPNATHQLTVVAPFDPSPEQLQDAALEAQRRFYDTSNEPN